jgi:hypothetical protein
MRTIHENRGLILLAVVFLLFTHHSMAQEVASASPIVKEALPATPMVVPQLAFDKTLRETINGIDNFRVYLSVANAAKISPSMLYVPAGRKLPPNPCNSSARYVGSIYDDKGALKASCLSFPTKESFGAFSFLIKEKYLPRSIYLSLLDQVSGKVSRSKAVSPMYPQHGGSSVSESGAR